MLQSMYPDITWDVWRFDPCPRDFWVARENRVLFFRRLREELSIEAEISDVSSWYKITTKNVTDFGGEGLLRANHNSLYAALNSTYPDLYLHPWKFEDLPAGPWTQDMTLPNLVNRLEELWSISDKAGWQKISRENIFALPESDVDVIYSNGGLVNILEKYFPHNTWDFSEVSPILKERGVHWLSQKVKEIFPESEILENHSISNTSTILDVCLPSEKIGFLYSSPDKKIIAQFKQEHPEFSVFCIPYWWKGGLNQLMATIKKERKDLLVDVTLPSASFPIPDYDPNARLSRQINRI
eukprot:TRINITY_DN7612_c0_g1_i2.p1 TRINITY_DN7612_c0_g1~~TRINITY_DN7612_c0_g1_i2.p1  ORF type:complete len:297 (-),score=64.49 TRINITY_DN7612_c0_g1_i2:150-1040(-)